MLTIPPEKVCYILIKAREFDEKVEADDIESGSNPSDDRDVNILADYEDDPTYQELMSALDSLNEDELLDLVALTWVGRGDFSKDEWEEARTEADDMRDKHIPLYLVGVPTLGDFLEEGLVELGYSCDEYELGRL